MRKITCFLLIGGLVLVAGCGSRGLHKNDDVTEPAHPVLALCEATDLLELAKRSTLQFTFNVRLPDKTVSREWRWDIREDVVQLGGTQVASDDKRFVNDKYWLLFPLMAYYDREITSVSVNRQSKSPISGQECTEVTIQYFGGGGYTPNDLYKLYCKEDRGVFEWAYYKSGKEPPARVTEWADYRDFNGISLSVTRPSDGEFKVWFTDVKIE